MRLILGTFIADFRSVDGELDFVPHGIERFAVSLPADVNVDVSVELRPVDTWISSEFVYPQVGGENGGVLELRHAGWNAVFDLKRRHVQAVLRWPAPSLFDILMRQVLEAFSVYDQTGLLLHASSVEAEGKAVLFLGRSEAGKSTAAALAASAGCSLLADDMIFVEVGKGREPRVHCLPIVQKNEGVLRPHTAPLGAVYAVSQSEVDHVEPLSANRCFREIMKATVLTVREPIFSEHCLSLAHRLASQVQCGHLRFRKTPAFWDVVREHMFSSSSALSTQ